MGQQQSTNEDYRYRIAYKNGNNYYISPVLGETQVCNDFSIAKKEYDKCVENTQDKYRLLRIRVKTYQFGLQNLNVEIIQQN
jgi:hypothetical protein